jgi:hypothetical protein
MGVSVQAGRDEKLSPSQRRLLVAGVRSAAILAAGEGGILPSCAESRAGCPAHPHAGCVRHSDARPPAFVSIRVHSWCS